VRSVVSSACLRTETCWMGIRFAIVRLPLSKRVPLVPESRPITTLCWHLAVPSAYHHDAEGQERWNMRRRAAAVCVAASVVTILASPLGAGKRRSQQVRSWQGVLPPWGLTHAAERPTIASVTPSCAASALPIRFRACLLMNRKMSCSGPKRKANNQSRRGIH